jgi:xanthine dehydrogenase small subunit
MRFHNRLYSVPAGPNLAGVRMRDFVLLYVNGRRLEVRGRRAFLPLSEFLRTTLRLTGTKVACAEGDCGSCTVLVGRVQADQLVYRPVTSCIQYMAQLDGAHIISVEGLLQNGALHPAQASMVAHHGAQCGYCTPGVVVALSALFDHTPEPSRSETSNALVGNLCRCTGYDQILEAAAHADRAGFVPLAELYDDRQMRRELAEASHESIAILDGARSLFKPASLEEAIQLRARHPDATILAGGTDLGVAWNKRLREVGTLICVGDLTEIQGQDVQANTWTIGAATTISELEEACNSILPPYRQMLERFGSPQIKHAGTLGGNLANGSPVGDTMPGLFVLDAEVELVGPSGPRRVNINKFYTGYRRSVLAADELIRSVVVPVPGRDELFATYKVSKRRDLDISSFAAALWMHVEEGIIRAARIALGGVAPTIVRLPRTEAWLSEQRLCESTLRAAGKVVREEITPISDVRGSAEYRLLLAENSLLKFARDLLERRDSVGAYQPEA